MSSMAGVVVLHKKRLTLEFILTKPQQASQIEPELGTAKVPVCLICLLFDRVWPGLFGSLEPPPPQHIKDSETSDLVSSIFVRVHINHVLKFETHFCFLFICLQCKLLPGQILHSSMYYKFTFKEGNKVFFTIRY